MRKGVFSAIMLLAFASLVLAAPFSPPVMKIVAPSVVQYNFDGTQLEFSATVSGAPTSALFGVFTKDQGAKIGAVLNGFLGWHYVNKIDTSIYISQSFALDIGKNTVKWNGKDENGKSVSAGEYSYYIWAFDNVNSKKIVTKQVAFQWNETSIVQIMDKDGKPIMENGKVKTLSMTQISQNIVTALTTFSDELAKGLENSKPKDAKKAIAKYSDIIEEISKFSESLTGLEKATDTISNLAKSISDLSISLDGFDQTKLSKLAAISVSAGGSPTPGVSGGGSTAEKLNEKTKAIKESSAVSPNWDLISAQIGESVGAKLVDAMKKGQMKFEFSPSSPGKGVLSFD